MCADGPGARVGRPKLPASDARHAWLPVRGGLSALAPGTRSSPRGGDAHRLPSLGRRRRRLRLLELLRRRLLPRRAPRAQAGDGSSQRGLAPRRQRGLHAAVGEEQVKHARAVRGREHVQPKRRLAPRVQHHGLRTNQEDEPLNHEEEEEGEERATQGQKTCVFARAKGADDGGGGG